MIHDNRQLQRESYRQDNKEKDGFERKTKNPSWLNIKILKEWNLKKKWQEIRNQKREHKPTVWYQWFSSNILMINSFVVEG